MEWTDSCHIKWWIAFFNKACQHVLMNTCLLVSTCIFWAKRVPLSERWRNTWYNALFSFILFTFSPYLLIFRAYPFSWTVDIAVRNCIGYTPYVQEGGGSLVKRHQQLARICSIVAVVEYLRCHLQFLKVLHS